VANDVPYSGEYHRPQGFFELLGKMNADLELTPEAIQYLLADDTVAIRCRLKFTARASGKSVEMSLVEIYTVRNGLITELDVYYSLDALELFGTYRGRRRTDTQGIRPRFRRPIFRGDRRVAQRLERVHPVPGLSRL